MKGMCSLGQLRPTQTKTSSSWMALSQVGLDVCATWGNSDRLRLKPQAAWKALSQTGLGLCAAWGQLRPTQTKTSDSLESSVTIGTGSSTVGRAQSTGTTTQPKFRHLHQNSKINITFSVAANRSMPTLAKGHFEAFARKNARIPPLARMASANVGTACCATLKHRAGQHC